MTLSGIDPNKLTSFDTMNLSSLGQGTQELPFHLFRGLVVEASLYSPYIRTSIIFEDAASMFETRLPILGEEKLELGFVDARGKSKKIDTYITTVSPIDYHEGRKMVGYILEGKSLQAINNPRTKCRDTFQDKLHSEIASEIAQRFLQVPFDTVDPTIAPPKFYYLQGGTAFQTLDTLKRFSWDGDPSMYVAYANFVSGQEKFNYRNVYKLLNQGSIFKFSVTDAVEEKREVDTLFLSGENIGRVQAITRPNQFNSSDLTYAGWAARCYQHFDIDNKNITEVVDEGSRPFQLGGKELHSAQFCDAYMKPVEGSENRRLYTLSATTHNDNKYRDKFNSSQPLIHALGKNEVTIQTPGVSEVSVGDVVELDEIRQDGYENRKKSVRYTGKWLVTSKKDSIGFDLSYVSKLVLSRESVNYEVTRPPRQRQPGRQA